MNEEKLIIDGIPLIKKINNWRNKDFADSKEYTDRAICDVLDSVIEMIYDTEPIQPQGIDKDRLIELINRIHRETIVDNAPYREIYEFTEVLEIVDEIVELINEQPQTGWIPCSERLPDENMWCLVTYQSGEVEKVKYCTTNNWGQNDECITAWQPLPQPYKE